MGRREQVLLQDCLNFICSASFDPSDVFDVPHAPPVRSVHTFHLQLQLLHLQTILACSCVSLSPGFALAPEGAAVYVGGQCVCSSVNETLQTGIDAVSRLLAMKMRGPTQVVAVPFGGNFHRVLVCGIGDNTCLMILMKIMKQQQQQQQQICTTICFDCSSVGDTVNSLQSSGTAARLLADMLQRSQAVCGGLSCTESASGTCSSFSLCLPSSSNISISSLAPSPSNDSLPHWPITSQPSSLIIPVTSIKRASHAPPMFEFLCANACGVRRPLWALACRDRVCG
jgi:hypothetical protein